MTTVDKPARIFATVNGEVSSFPAGTRHLIGGWSTNSDSSRASEYVRGDIADDMLAALHLAEPILGNGPVTLETMAAYKAVADAIALANGMPRAATAPTA